MTLNGSRPFPFSLDTILAKYASGTVTTGQMQKDVESLAAMVQELLVQVKFLAGQIDQTNSDAAGAVLTVKALVSAVGTIAIPFALTERVAGEELEITDIEGPYGLVKQFRLIQRKDTM